MSWRVAAWAKKQRTGLAGAKATLMMLADYANVQGVAWPNQQQLADDTEQSLDSIQRHIALLVDQGLISVKRRPGPQGQWPSLEYRLPFNKPRVVGETEPHHAARTMPHHAARTMPHHAPSPSRKYPPDRAAPCGTNLQENRQDNRLEPHEVRPEPAVSKNLEGEPSKEAVPEPALSRQEEEQRLAEERKKRPTEEEMRQLYPDLLRPRLKRM